jgi:hypothetical protein
MQNETKIVVRVARAGDAADIFALLKRCADEIPVEIDGNEGDRLAGLVGGWSQNGSSFVAVANKRIVGFLLTSSILEADNNRRFEYGAVASEYRGQGIFPRMLDRAKAISVCLYAAVQDANKSDMADRLKKAGFSDMGFSSPTANGRMFRWRSDLPRGISSLPPDAED